MSNELHDLLGRGAATPSSGVDVDALVRTARGRRRRRIGAIAGAIVALVAVVVGTIAIVQPSSEVSIASRPAASAPAGWTVVRNDDGDVSLAIPPEWTQLDPWGDESITVGTAAFPRTGTILPCALLQAQVPPVAGTWVSLFQDRDLQPGEEFPLALVPALRTTSSWVMDRPPDLRDAVHSIGSCGETTSADGTSTIPTATSRYDVVAFRDAGRVFVAVLGTTDPGDGSLAVAYEVLNTLTVGDPGMPTSTTAAAAPPTTTPTTVPPATVPVGTAKLSGDEAAVRDVFLAWINAQPKDALDGIVEDFASIAETHRQGVAQHTATDLALYSGRVDSVTVLSATRAEVQYTILHDGQPQYSMMPGEAIKIDGKWMVTRQTVCNLLKYGNLTCPPRA